MTEKKKAQPLGFTIVPPRLEAINFLFHIDRMASGRRAQTIHSTSRKCHKFKKLQADLVEWRKTPTSHVKDMKAAYKEWSIPGIREIKDQPGRFMFARAILTEPEPTRIRTLPSIIVGSKVTVGVGSKVTVGTPNSADTDTTTPARAPPTRPARTPARTPAVNHPFFSLDPKSATSPSANSTDDATASPTTLQWIGNGCQ
jgi:hypothetical protein